MLLTSPQDPYQLSPEVTVIIPTYNRCLMLQEALTSVTSQEFDGLVEIIVVDDNSQDGTSETVAQKYPFVRIISLKQNVGPSAARNRAILQARGNYIAFLDSDDLWETNHLKTQIEVLEGKYKCFSVSDLVIWDTAKEHKRLEIQRPNSEKYASPVHHFLVSGFIITLSSVVIPRQAFTEVGLFDENFMLGEDNELYLRCLLSDYRVVCTEQPTVIKRKHSRDQLADAKNLKLKEKYRFMRINKLYPLTRGYLDIPPIRCIYAETYTHFASQHFRNNDFLNWLTSSIAAANNSSPGYALLSMLRDIKARTLHRLRRPLFLIQIF